MIITRTVSLAVLAVSATALVAAAEPLKSGQVKPALSRLKTAEEDLARRADRTKGGPRQRLLLERNNLDHLIDDLERGRTVPPDEIDRALQRSEQATP